MNNFEFDDIIRRKLENAKFEGADAAFSKIKGKLARRRYYFYLSRTLPYMGMLLLGMGMGYLINEFKNNKSNLIIEKLNTRNFESILAIEKNINSSKSYNSFSTTKKFNIEDQSFYDQTSVPEAKNKVKQSKTFIISHNITTENNNKNDLHTNNLNHYQHIIDLTNNNIESNLNLVVEENSALQSFPNKNEKENQNDSMLKGKNFIVVIDSAKLLNNPPLNYFKEKKNVFYFHVFGGYSFGWQNSGITNARGLIPEVGLIYERNLPENMIFSTGFNLTMIRNLKNCVNTFTVIEADTRYKQTVWEFKTPVIYYLRMPIILGLKNNSGRNFVQCGLLINFLMNSKNDITKYSYSSSRQINIESMTEYGYAMDGFHRLNTEFTLGFRRRINKNLRVGINLNHHITDVVRNYNFFDNQQREPSKAPSFYAGIEYKF